MKRILIIGVIVVFLSSLTILTIPVFAHSPIEEDTGIADQETWQEMHEACEDGDWEAMVQAAEEVHGNFDYAPCHNAGYLDSEDGNPSSWGSMMDGQIGSWGGMMGW